MRKHAFVAVIMLMMSILAGCGGDGGTSSTLVASSNEKIKAEDISNYISGKTLYSVSSTTNSPTRYDFGSGTTTGTLTKNNVSDGTWTYTEATGEITITPSSGTMNLRRIQTEASGTANEYWLVYDANTSTVPANKIYRFYVHQTNGLTAANAYLTSIFKSASTYLMGGAIQWLAGSNPNIDFSTKTVSTLAGSNTDTPAASIDASGTFARFNHPTGMTTDGNGYLYVTDKGNHTVRRIQISDGAVLTFAGVAGTAGSANGTGTSATFSSPQGIACDGTYLYITDTGNATIRRIEISTQAVTTLAGLAGTLGAVDNTSSGANARFYGPKGITTDGTNLYVTDESYHTIRKIQIATGTDGYSKSVTTLAGYPASIGATDGTGTTARFNQPSHITTDGTYLFVTDLNNHTIRKIVIASGVTTTLAGTAGATNLGMANYGDETGTSARFYFPSAITTDGTNLYVTEFNNTNSTNLIRKITISSGTVTTIAGGPSGDVPSDATALNARFYRLLGITTDGSSLYVTNYSNAYTSQLGIEYPSINNIRQIGP